MAKGILGRKVGMTQIFTKSDILVPVIVIEAALNIVLQTKTDESGGYEAIQVDYQDIREVLSDRPAKGHTAEAKTLPKCFTQEVRDVELKDYEVGPEITVDSFSKGDIVNVTGTTRSHGTQGNIRRWGQSKGPETHGSRYHRIPGSMGSIINRIPESKKLPDHMGGKKVTVQSLIIEKVVPEKNVLLIKGNVPGTKSSLIFIKSAAETAK